ncbi:restriction endonuclease subunit S [Qipengyuania citrea]|uniref:restriction endonuclease subunit S n=1 Tax=Qipengyuania citrea TaxID=225971 RepID=UPI003298BA99
MNVVTQTDTVSSGQEWIGSLPADWKVQRIGQLFRERNVKVSDKDYQPLSVTKSGIVPQMEHVAKTNDNDNRKLVIAGDFVINSRSDRKGSSGLSPLDGSVSLINIVLHPQRGIIPDFAHHLLRSHAFQEEFYRMGNGLVADLWTTNYGSMKAISIPVPPEDEQIAVARFLDRETSRIDSLIDRKNRFIALLNEKRDAVISHAVTRGLSSDVPMQTSDISSIGNVPAHWKLNPIGRSMQLTKKIVGKRHSEFKLLSLTTKGIIERDISQNFGKFPESFDTYQEVQPGNFVFCLFDMDETPRTVGLSENAGMITGAYAVFECTEPAYSRYLLNLFLHLDNCKGLKPFYTGLRKTIRPPRFTSIRIPFPPEDEAREIAEHIERQCAKIDQLVERTKRSIELLREHRTALITAAVTGKIDVRNAA